MRYKIQVPHPRLFQILIRCPDDNGAFDSNTVKCQCSHENNLPWRIARGINPGRCRRSERAAEASCPACCVCVVHCEQHEARSRLGNKFPPWAAHALCRSAGINPCQNQSPGAPPAGRGRETASTAASRSLKRFCGSLRCRRRRHQAFCSRCDNIARR